MKKAIDKERILRFESMSHPLSLQEAVKEAYRCLLCEDPPCSKGCPAGTDPGKFIRQIRFENFKGAARTIRKNNPMGRICALVCPVEELCERECSIKALEEPINIGGLQLFASQYGEQYGLEPLQKSNGKNGRIAVVGAGPAGFGCASELAKRNYRVTIFEKESEACGVPKWGIPAFRLPQKALDFDLQNLLNLGVEIKFNCNLTGKDAIAKLLKQDFNAVFIGAGLTKPFTMSLLDGYKNAVSSSEFLYRAEKNRKKSRLDGKSVVVIGGGSVAMDTASTAAVLGAARVYIVYRRSMQEMPAALAEIEVAQSMNVTFRTFSVIKEVIANAKTITGLKGTEVEWTEHPDRNKKTSVEIEGTGFTLKCDLVIQAMGSLAATDDITTAIALETGKTGLIKVDKKFRTSIPGVFAGGDIVNGGATVVQAVGEGKMAALAIDAYLKKGGA